VSLGETCRRERKVEAKAPVHQCRRALLRREDVPLWMKRRVRMSKGSSEGGSFVRGRVRNEERGTKDEDEQGEGEMMSVCLFLALERRCSACLQTDPTCQKSSRKHIRRGNDVTVYTRGNCCQNWGILVLKVIQGFNRSAPAQPVIHYSAHGV